MAKYSYEYKGHIVDFDSEPTAELLSQWDNYIDTLPSKDKKKTSLEEDFKIGLANVGKTALGAGFNAAGYLSNDFEAANKERQSVDKMYDQWANPENKEQSFGGKAVSLVSTLPSQILTTPLSGFQTYNTAKDLGESEKTAKDMAGIDTAFNIVGLGAPGMVGKTVLGKTISGAGINAAQDTASRLAISAKAEKEKTKETFNPTLETAALAAIPGAGIGLTHGLHAKAKESLNSVEPLLDVNYPVDKNKALLEARYEIAKQQREAAKAEISFLETELSQSGSKRFRTPETAEIFKRILEQRIAREKERSSRADILINELENDLGIKKEVVTPPIKEKVETPIEEITINGIKEESDPEATTIRSNRPYSVEELPIENLKQEIEQLKQQPDEQSKKLASIIEEELSEPTPKDTTENIGYGYDPTTGLTGKEVEQMVLQEQKAKEAPGPKIIGEKDATEKQLVLDILKKFGLEKEDITINLSDTTLGESRGRASILDADQYNVKINENLGSATRDLSEERNSLYKSLPTEDRKRFLRAWTIGHEIGHVLMYKLLFTKMWDGHVQKIIDDFNKWSEKHPDIAKQTGAVLPERQVSKHIDNYKYFAEYFAQRVAENLANPSKPRSIFKDYINNMKKVWHDLVIKFKLPSAFKPVDELIRHIIDSNKESLETTGKNLWEFESVKRSVDEVTSLVVSKTFPNGTKSLFDTVEPLETVLSKQLSRPDIGPVAVDASYNFVNKIVNGFQSVFFGLQQKKGIWFNEPAVKYASDVILNAMNEKISITNKLLLGVPDRVVNNKFIFTLKRIATEGSIKKILERTSAEDLYVIHDLFKQGIGKLDYEKNLLLNGKHLTKSQRIAYLSLAKMFKDLHTTMNVKRKLLGKDRIIPNKLGWYPSIRDMGKFTVNLHYGSPLVKEFGFEGTVLSDVIYSQRFFSRSEAEDFIKWYNKQNNTFGIKVGQVEEYKQNTKESFANLKQDFMDELFDTIDFANDSAEIRQALIELNNKYIQEKGKLGGHHKLRLNVPGNKGTELWFNKEQLGNSFRDGIFDSIEEYTSLLMKDTIKTKLNPLVENPDFKEQRKNVFEVVQSMRDYSLNDFGKWEHYEHYKDNINDLINRIVLRATPENQRYLKTHFNDAALGKITRLFYIFALTSRPSFWAAQGSQFLWVTRSMVKDDVGMLRAMVDSGKGIYTASTQPKDFKEALRYVTNELHTFHPQFINDLNTFGMEHMAEGGKVKNIFDLITGEKQSSSADTFSRYMAFSMAFEHYKSKGLTGIELAKKAAEVTDENMVQYGKQYKAPIFNKLGPIGDLVSPLQTFSQASLGNLIADIKYYKANPLSLKAAQPALMTLAISGIMAGAIGTPLFAEIEILLRLYNYFAERYNWERVQTLTEMLLSGDSSIGNEILLHGAISTSTKAVSEEGFDIGSSLRWQPILGGIIQGEKTMLEIIPALNWAFDEAKAVKTVVQSTFDKSITDAEKRNAQNQLIPGYWKGFKQSFDDTMTKDMFGRANRPNTFDEKVAKFLGTKTLPAAREAREQKIMKERKLSQNEEKRRLILNAVDAYQNGDKQLTSEYLQEYAKRYKVDPSLMYKSFKTELYKRQVPKGMRQFVGSKGTPSRTNINDYIMYKEMFEKDPEYFREEEE